MPKVILGPHMWSQEKATRMIATLGSTTVSARNQRIRVRMTTMKQSEAPEEKQKEEKAKEKEKERKAKTEVKAQKGAKTREKAKLAETPKAKVGDKHLHLSGQPHLVEKHRQGRRTDHLAISF